MKKKFDIILVASANYQHLSKAKLNVHQIAERFADKGHKVLFVESLGLKTFPVYSGRDFKKVILRIVNFLKSFLGKPVRVKENLSVISPIRLPFDQIKVVQYLNRKLVTAFIKSKSEKNLHTGVLWVFLPTQQYLFDSLPAELKVYFAVDDYLEVPGVDKKYIYEQERLACDKADLIFTVSESVKNRFESFTKKNVDVLLNVADFELFNKSDMVDYKVPSDMKDILRKEKPIATFFGNIASYKLDMNLLYRVVSGNPQIEFFMIGQVGAGDREAPDIQKLKRLGNITFVGPKEQTLLPKYMHFSDVAFLILKKNKAVFGGFPVKFFEYLATGLPVLTTDLKHLYPFIKDKAIASIYSDSKTFGDAVKYWCTLKRDAGTEYEKLKGERLALARQYTWKNRIDFFERIFYSKLTDI
jgi:glycosyltransferase involved in cell wall biosynthesis